MAVPISLDKLLEGYLTFMKSTYKVLVVAFGNETIERLALKNDVITKFYV